MIEWNTPVRDDIV